MGFAIVAFIVFFLLIGSGLLLVFYRELLGQRLAGALSPRGDSGPDSAGLISRHRPSFADRMGIRQRAESFGALAGPLLKLGEDTGAKPSAVKQRLMLAGYRAEGAIKIFSAGKVLAPVSLCAASFATGLYLWNPFIVIVVALGFGYLLPDYWLDRRIKSRAEAIRLGLPDLLDLLVVCVEAGLSLDQAAVRSSEEMSIAHPAVADEIGLVMLEVRAGQPRLQAWKHLAERANIDSVRMLVSVLVQADQFGTSIARTLRTQAETLRVRRRQRVEELAARTTVKLIFPLVLFIFPSFFIVLLGPAVITISEAFAHL
jgi:tight adherence protein C